MKINKKCYMCKNYFEYFNENKTYSDEYKLYLEYIKNNENNIPNIVKYNKKEIIEGFNELPF
jgi:hypothetical protein